MTKKISLLLMALITAVGLCACGNKTLEDAKVSIVAYNTAVDEYSEKTAAYNETVTDIESENEKLEQAINTVQELLNRGEQPYDVSTLESLRTVLASAKEATISVPKKLTTYEKLTVDDKTKSDDLKKIREKANSDIEAIKSATIPVTPKIPDYSTVTKSLSDAQLAYEDSIQSLKQITAPADNFVISRLQTIDTINNLAPVTENNDPNGKLGKQGGYIGCIYFSDNRIDKSQLYLEDGKDDVISVGCIGGGAIEVYSCVEDAQTRDTYLSSFDGTAFTSGSHYVVGTCLVRTSDELAGTQQKDLTKKITQALVKIEH